MVAPGAPAVGGRGSGGGWRGLRPGGAGPGPGRGGERRTEVAGAARTRRAPRVVPPARDGGNSEQDGRWVTRLRPSPPSGSELTRGEGSDAPRNQAPRWVRVYGRKWASSGLPARPEGSPAGPPALPERVLVGPPARGLSGRTGRRSLQRCSSPRLRRGWTVPAADARRLLPGPALSCWTGGLCRKAVVHITFCLTLQLAFGWSSVSRGRAFPVPSSMSVFFIPRPQFPPQHMHSRLNG